MPRQKKPTTTHGLEVGFCDSFGNGFLSEQPADQIERWALPRDNGTHLVIPWRPHARACGRNVTAYMVDVETSASFLNFFIGAFGSFPQDMCDPTGSKAREATSATAATCAPYVRRADASPTNRGDAASDVHIPRRRVRVAGTRTSSRDRRARLRYEDRCRDRERIATFVAPPALRKLTLLDVEVTVRAYGSLAPLNKPDEPGEAVTHWCHRYRRARPAVSEAKRPWWRPGPAPSPAGPPAGAIANAYQGGVEISYFGETEFSRRRTAGVALVPTR